MLEGLGLAHVKRVAPTPQFGPLSAGGRWGDGAGGDRQSLRRAGPLCAFAAGDVPRRTLAWRTARISAACGAIWRWMRLPCRARRGRLDGLLARSGALATAYRMRDELSTLWARSNASREQLVRELQDWCQRAEARASGNSKSSGRLRRYVVA